MPYMPLGNLENLHSARPIDGEETEAIVFQTLSALAHLHPQSVAHRDLKPENILVESRDPLSIKVADFGLASDSVELKTLCGTPGYVAPEVYYRKLYTPAVDLWSLGVIALKYLHGLPAGTPPRLRSSDGDRARSACRNLVAYARQRSHENQIL